MGVARNPPAADQVEVTLLGPGHGESIVMHLGNGNWIVVDSCEDSETGRSAALDYLDGIGVPPAEAVRFVLATHWHDDHVRGMADLLTVCNEADFCCSSAWGKEEFIAMVSLYEATHTSKSSSGVHEVREMFRVLEDRPPSRKAGPDTRVFRLCASESGHGHECAVTTLSPSDAQIDKFYAEIARSMPEVKMTRRRCTAQRPNHVAVAAWVEIGHIAILLGSDLEETSNPNTGWSVIVKSKTRPQGRASVFKVAHHGSENAHNYDVWSKMLAEAPFSILTPFRRSHLPKPTDVERITGLTPDAYITTKVRSPRVRTKNAAVESTLRDMKTRLTRAEPKTSALRLRNGGINSFETWSVETLRDACHLSDAYK